MVSLRQWPLGRQEVQYQPKQGKELGGAEVVCDTDLYEGWKGVVESLTIACAEDSRKRNNMMLKPPPRARKHLQKQLRDSSM